MCFCPLNRSKKCDSLYGFQGKHLPSSFACRFLHYGWSRHGIHTWHGTKCTSQWEFSYSRIFPSQKKKNRTWKNSCPSFSTTRHVPWSLETYPGFSSRMQLGQAVPESIVLKELLSPLCAVQAKFYLNCVADICGKKNVKHRLTRLLFYSSLSVDCLGKSISRINYVSNCFNMLIRKSTTQPYLLKLVSRNIQQ